LLRLLDLPLGEGADTTPLIFVAAAGDGASGRHAALSASFDGGATWQDLGGTAAPAVMGAALDALAPAGSALFDAVSSLDVELLNDAMWLEGRNDDALVAGANLAAVGDELIQFGSVEMLGERRFRLSRLLRGRRGTEWAAESHLAGEPFTLIARETLVPIEAPAGAEARLLASGVGDMPDPAEAVRVAAAEGLRPPAPVHLRAVETPTGDLALSWVRRSRQGWIWTDGADTPLGEEVERYRVILAGPGFTRAVETTGASYLYSAGERAADGPGPITLSVIQAGTHAVSRPTMPFVD
jgi:hypothetical protein